MIDSSVFIRRPIHMEHEWVRLSTNSSWPDWLIDCATSRLLSNCSWCQSWWFNLRSSLLKQQTFKHPQHRNIRSKGPSCCLIHHWQVPFFLRADFSFLWRCVNLDGSFFRSLLFRPSNTSSLFGHLFSGQQTREHHNIMGRWEFVRRPFDVDSTAPFFLSAFCYDEYIST